VIAAAVAKKILNDRRLGDDVLAAFHFTVKDPQGVRGDSSLAIFAELTLFPLQELENGFPK